jgi:selenocysteine lyase/cysteine desulfurase
MSPTSHKVAEAGHAAVDRKKRPYLITPEDFFTDVLRLKTLFAQLVHAESAHRVALIPAASYGIATVAQNLRVSPGQRIVLTEGQFPSNVYSWRELAQREGLHITTVPYPMEHKEGRGALWQQRILESIDAQTAVVAMGHVHWANGTRFDLAAIGKRCKEVGAKLVIDGTQSVGALPIDVQAMGIDALICGGYKWLMGPYSLSYAYFSEAFDGGRPLEDNWITRKNSEDFRGLIDYQDEYQPGATRYDMGERSNFILVPMGIAALEQLLHWGVENIQQYCHRLTLDTIPYWRERGDYWVETPDWRSAHLFGVQLPAYTDANHLMQRLRERKIYVSMRGDFVRIAPNVYNNGDDIQALTAALFAE